MGREPLGLPVSGKEHTCCPGPPSAPPALKLWANLPNKGSLLGPEPASLPCTPKLSKLAKQTSLPVQPSIGDLGCSGPSLRRKNKESKSFGFDFPSQATSGPRNSSSCHKLHQCTSVDALAGSGVWVCPLRGLRSPPADYSSLPLRQQICMIPIAIGYLICSNDVASCCVNREVKTQKLADEMWSRTCTPYPGVWMREPLLYGLLLIL
eukprot:284129-Pelagomonas_calceolata.AAC.7